MTDEYAFEDVDPEDAWDDGDSFAERLDVVERLVPHLRVTHDERFEARRTDGLRLLGKLTSKGGGRRSRNHPSRSSEMRLAALRDELESL